MCMACVSCVIQGVRYVSCVIQGVRYAGGFSEAWSVAADGNRLDVFE